MNSTDLTITRVAEELGVHYMTAYRYVRTGLLPGAKSGNTWVVSRDSLRDFVSKPPAQPGRGHRQLGRQVEPIINALVRGDERGAWRIAKALQSAGCGIEELCTELFAPAMAKIGADWAAGERTIADEHRASVVLPLLLGRLRSTPLPSGRKRGVIIVGCPPEEDHGIPAAIFSLLLERQRFDVDNLGGNTPPSTFAEAAQCVEKPIAVVFSVTVNAGLKNLSECVAAVRSVQPTTQLLAGGPAVAGTDQAKLGLDAVIPSFAAGLDAVISIVD